MKVVVSFPLLYAMLWAQWGLYGARSLTGDLRATAVGDVITIVVVEDAQASNAAQTAEQRNGELQMGLQSTFNQFGLKAGWRFQSGSDIRGRGETSRTERIRARLTARIVALDSLGNLVVEGQRTTRINGEEQTIRIRGRVRPIDLGPDNTIPSHALSELVLIYDGEGSVSRAQEPGLITRLLRLLF